VALHGGVSMSDTTRRRVLQILTVGGLTATIALPSRWIKPVVEAIVVPAHAQASPNKTPLRGTTVTTTRTTGTTGTTRTTGTTFTTGTTVTTGTTATTSTSTSTSTTSTSNTTGGPV
jgi:hypothetical protein